MGIQQVNKQQLALVIGAVAVGILFLAWVSYLIFFQKEEASTNPNEGTVNYTSSITGEPSAAFPAEAIEGEGAVPRIKIEGFDTISDKYSGERTSAIQTALSYYVATLSNGQASRTGIVDRTLRTNGNTTEFTLFIDRPESYYTVKITYNNDEQTEPDMTFTKVEE